MEDNKKVKKYFDDGAKDFDEIYDWMDGNLKKKSKNFISKVFRRAMVERFELALKDVIPNKKLLDIGCGSGRVSLEIAKRGVNVTGIDYSRQMIQLANDYKNIYEKTNNVKLNLQYVYADFLKDFNEEKKYDISLALGVFDYIEDTIKFHEMIKRITKSIILASYPAKFTFQTPIRKLWLWKRQCPVYFYTKKKIKSIYNKINIHNIEIIQISAGYYVRAYL